MALYQGPKVKTPLRQFVRPKPGSNYSSAQRAEWGAEQDRARAARTAGTEPKATPAKRATRSKVLVADTAGSECFDSLEYSDGTVTASFIGPASGEWTYDISLAEAKEWFSDDSLGGYFNDNVREPPDKGN
jgi:hypothetical protein